MKKILYILTLAAGAVLTSCHTSRTVVSTPKAAKSIVVVYDNDVHCGIESYAKMAGLRDAVADTSYAALVSSGDFLQGGTAGAISKGQYIADIMKHMHYDAVTLGNHEFDYYVPRMEELLRDIGAPVVCCNLYDMEGNTVYAPYTIKRYGDKRVAFVGAVTPTARYTEEYAFFDNAGSQIYELREKDTYQKVQDAVDKARSEGADYVIVLSHLGEDKNDINVDSHGLIQSTRGIDVVLDGHTHSVIPTETVMNKDGKPVLITQTGTKFQNFGKLVIMPDGRMTTHLIPPSDVTRENPEVRHATDSINALAKALVSRPICKSDVDLRILEDDGRQAVRLRETNAGDIVTDAYRHVTGADLAITNGGGIRTEVKAGNLTYGDIVSLLPYDNYVSILDISGQMLFDLLCSVTRFLPVENGDFPQVSGIRFTVNTADYAKKNNVPPVSDLVILNKQTGEYEPVHPLKTYKLATIDYCITGGGLQGVLKKHPVAKPNIMIYNECLIQYVTEHLKGHIGSEYAEPQGRIKINY